MLTGQISSHALHDVQAQSSSGVMRSNRELALMVISGSTPMGGRHRSPGSRGRHHLAGLERDLMGVERVPGQRHRQAPRPP